MCVGCLLWCVRVLAESRALPKPNNPSRQEQNPRAVITNYYRDHPHIYYVPLLPYPVMSEPGTNSGRLANRHSNLNRHRARRSQSRPSGGAIAVGIRDNRLEKVRSPGRVASISRGGGSSLFSTFLGEPGWRSPNPKQIRGNQSMGR